MATLEEKKRFGRVSNGYEPISRKPAQKPKNGTLYVDGKEYKRDLPFPLLQSIRSKLILDGMNRKRISIKYFR